MILKKAFKVQAPCGTHGSDTVKAFSFFDFKGVELVSSTFFLCGFKN